MAGATEDPERSAFELARRRHSPRGSLAAHERADRRARMASVSATVTVIDRGRGLMPRAFDRKASESADPAARARLARLLAATERRDALGILEVALKGELAGRTAVVSSFGSESVVLLHMVAQIDPTTPILFLNTGKLFGETLRYRDRLQDELGLADVRSLSPGLDTRRALDADGSLWSRDTDSCCGFRKVAPLAAALKPFAAQITGRKRFQTRERTLMQPVEWFDGRFRFNPLWRWTQDDLQSYA